MTESSDAASLALRELTGPELADRVLRASVDPEVQNLVFWRMGPYGLTFYVDCTDLFELGREDEQPITAATIHAFERAIADVRQITGGDATYGPALYVARERGRRPMNVSYPTDNRLWIMFDAVGPQGGDGSPRPSGEPAPVFLPPTEVYRAALADGGVAFGPVPAAWCGDFPAPCNCDDPTTHDGAGPPESPAPGVDVPAVEATEAEPCHPATQPPGGGPDHCGQCGTPYAQGEQAVAP